jgi:predicted negative regulator of RcsB-dependent stress response
MKRTERRHLKDNELAVATASIRQAVEERKQQILTAAVVIAVAAAAALGYLLWNAHVQGQAHQLLADAIAIDQSPVGQGSNPDAPNYFPNERQRSQAALTKFKIAADAYPKTQDGIFARYMEAATMLKVGTPADAGARYQQVIDQAGDSFYGDMARLGLAQTQAQTGQYDQAIATYKQLAEKKDTQMPVDGLLMQLARTYLDAGKTAEAQQTFNRIVQEYPDSAFSLEARQALDNLKTKKG